MEQKLILHHVESFDDGAIAACGSMYWAHASKGWSGVDCPGCLSAQHRVNPTRATPWLKMSYSDKFMVLRSRPCG